MRIKSPSPFITIYLSEKHNYIDLLQLLSCIIEDIAMKTTQEIKSGLNRHSSKYPSRWRENAEWRMANREWLRYSQRIAMMMLDRMEELGLNQKAVAERMGCSQQYVSRVLKGTENLSIETISKIEAALEMQIMEPITIRSKDL